jgi:hypothetical protein
MALVWFDKRDMNLHMVRNLQRPLEYALSKDNKTIFWASEDWMFQVSAKRRKVELQPTEIVKSNTHYTISQDNGVITIEKEDLIPFQPPKVVYTPPATTTSGNWNGRSGYKTTKKSSAAQLTVSVDYFVPNEEAGKFKGYFMGRNLQTGQLVVINVPYYHYEELIAKLNKAGKDVKYRFGYDKIKWEQGADTKYFGVCNAVDLGDPVLEPKILSFRPKKEDKEVYENKEVAVGFRGNPLNKQDFIFSAMHGCFWCKCHLQWEDKETTVWVSPSTAVCDECQKLPEVKEVIREVEEEFRQLAI